MWTFFKTVFNILRNISLLIVLAIVGCFAWTWTDEDRRQELVDAFEEERVIAEKNEREEETFGIQSFQYEEEEVDNSSQVLGIEIRKANGGLRYLIPSEVMYFSKYGLNEYLVTDENEMVRTDIKLKNVFQKLEKFRGHYFFKTKNNIINCKYIKDIDPENKSEFGNNYGYNIKMKNGDSINVNKNRITELKNMMKKISHQIK